MACCTYYSILAPQEFHLPMRIQQGKAVLFPFLLYSGMQNLYSFFVYDLAKNKSGRNTSESIMRRNKTMFLKVKLTRERKWYPRNNGKMGPNWVMWTWKLSNLNQPGSNSSWIQEYWHWNDLRKNYVLIVLEITVLTPEGWMVIYNFCPADIHWPHQNTPRVTPSVVKQVAGSLTGRGLWASHQRVGGG